MTAILKDRDIVRTMLAVLLVGSLLAACFWILHPFLPAIIWATMVVVATWPILLGIQRRLWGKRGLAVTAILYSNGERAASRINRFAYRMAGQRGEDAVALAGKSIRAVALGVIVTALIQSFLAGMGLSIAGIPYVTFLTAIIFVLVVAQVGLFPVMVPAIIWLYWNNNPGAGTLLLIWTIVVGSLDNFLKPILIKRSANLSLTIVFIGVIGGLIAFGVIGIFIGPALLAVSSTLLTVWMDEYGAEENDDSAKVSEETTGNESPVKNSLVAESNGKAPIPEV